MSNYKYYKDNNIKFPLTKDKLKYYLNWGFKVACYKITLIGPLYCVISNIKSYNIDNIRCFNRNDIRKCLNCRPWWIDKHYHY